MGPMPIGRWEIQNKQQYFWSNVCLGIFFILLAVVCTLWFLNFCELCVCFFWFLLQFWFCCCYCCLFPSLFIYFYFILIFLKRKQAIFIHYRYLSKFPHPPSSHFFHISSLPTLIKSSEKVRYIVWGKV